MWILTLDSRAMNDVLKISSFSTPEIETFVSPGILLIEVDMSLRGGGGVLLLVKIIC